MPRQAPTYSKEDLHWSFSAEATVVTLNNLYSPSKGHLASHPTFINPTIHLLSHTIFTRSPVEHVLYLEAMWPRLLFPHLLNEWTQEGIKILRSPSHQDHFEQPGSKTRKNA